ncbi:MAG: helix-turn-helix domain-containing protein [Burkholderiaceae bacterium]
MASTSIAFSKRVRRNRIKNAWSQAELGAKLGVAQMTISNLEKGKIKLTRDRKRAILTALGVSMPSANAVDVPADESLSDGPSAFGAWLSRVRLEKKLSVGELSERAGVSRPAIYNIEAGRITNPREETVGRLEKALREKVPSDTREEVRDEATIEGVGEFFEFDPLNKDDWPTVAGIYVLYDISERPIYVGQGSSIKSRIKDREEKFWFKSPIVTTAAYIKVEDEALRRKIETILIRFLKKNAVINKQHVGR